MERKLTAILCADVYGYSRLMGDNEEATFRTLASHRKIIDGLIEQHHGRFVNSAGDSVLAEFASVVNAVQCGIEIQAALKAENALLPENRRMEFRLGINLGDVIVDGEQIYGDGVNVAARLESLAEPGGICISHTVHDQVANKLPLSYEDVGEQSVKNIAKPVRVFRVLPTGTATLRETQPVVRRHLRRGAFSVVGLCIIAAIIVLVQHVSLKPPRTSASIPPAQKPALALPDKPSIAVLPFANMSGDHEQEYFSDGITDDLITDLSRLPGLFVIARDSTFTYKGKTAKLQDVSKELGVKYVLEGSVRKAADQVRITVQLADATTGTELWAERYDRPLRDVFALQDEIVRRIVTTLNLQIALSQQGIVIPRSTDNLEAYDDLLRGTQYLVSDTKDGNIKARQMFEKAIALDRRYSAAYVLLAASYFQGWVLSFNPDPNGLERAFQLVQQSIALDDSIAIAHGQLAAIYVQRGQNDQALAEAQRGIALDGNSADSYFWLAEVLNNQGKPTEALIAAQKAMRLDPRNGANYLFEEGFAYSQLGLWEEAIPALRTCLARYPNHLWARAWLAVDYFNLGDRDAARAATAQVERAVALTPSAMGYSALAFILNAQDRPKEALMATDQGIRLDPQSRGILFHRAIAYSQLGRWEEALAVLKRYVAHYPDDPFGHVGMAWSYSALGEMDSARAETNEIQRALTLDPSGEAYGGLADALNSTGRPTEALAAAEKAMRLDPKSREYLYEQGRAYTQLGHWAEAISAMQGFLVRHPDQVWPHVDLAVDYVELGQGDAARAQVAEILKVDPTFSLKTGVEGEFPAQRERAVDLAKAGLK
jgi:adenylate cyclase